MAVIQSCMFSTRSIFAFKVFVVALSLATGVCAQTASSNLKGIVRNMSGAPVKDAHVSIRQGGDANPREAITDTEGRFSLSNLSSDDFQLRVKKDGCKDSELELKEPISAAKPLVISLTCVISDATAGSALQFSDDPGFTVAGVTDWTAAGGHGSDVNLRASESLAKDTLGLGSTAGGHRPVSPEVETELRAELARNPSDFTANRALGEFCLRARHFRESIPPLEKARELNAADHEVAYELAQAYEGAGEHAKARNLVRTLLAQNDTSALHRLLGDIDENLDDPLAAEHEYERAVQLDPSEENYFAWGGELLLHRAVEAAMEVFTKGVSAFSRSERMLSGLGAALYAHGAYEEAASRMCEASALNPDDVQPYLFLGRMEQASPRPLPCAERRLERFVRNQPDNALANFYYAVSLLKRHEEAKEAEAEALLKNAALNDPRFAEAYLQLGVLQVRRGEADNAKISFERAANADPKFPDPHFRLAQIYERAGDKQRAAQELQTFERLKQSDAAAVERRRREIRQFVVLLKNPTPKPAEHP